MGQRPRAKSGFCLKTSVGFKRRFIAEFLSHAFGAMHPAEFPSRSQGVAGLRRQPLHSQELQSDLAFTRAVEFGENDALELSEDGFPVHDRQHDAVAKQQAAKV